MAKYMDGSGNEFLQIQRGVMSLCEIAKSGNELAAGLLIGEAYRRVLDYQNDSLTKIIEKVNKNIVYGPSINFVSPPSRLNKVVGGLLKYINRVDKNIHSHQVEASA